MLEDKTARHYYGYAVVVTIMRVRNQLGSGIEDENMMTPDLLPDVLCRSNAESRRKPRSRISNSSIDDDEQKANEYTIQV